MSKIILHIAQIDITEESGMGRVAWHWREGFLRQGYEFIHIGNREIPSVRHPSLFPYMAYRAYKKLNIKPDVILVHEPAGGVFVRKDVPVVVFSHGVEQRGWELEKAWRTNTMRLRTRLLYPLWRLRQSNKALKYADKLLLINTEDSNFVQARFKRSSNDILLFRNGIYESSASVPGKKNVNPVVLFLGTWIERKGIHTLIAAATKLYAQGHTIKWLLAGTGGSVSEVMKDWPDELRPHLEIIPKFSMGEECNILSMANIMILPSFFEGQPLALLQAMEAAKCCIVSDCCGQKDLIKHGYNGFLHPPGEVQKLVELLEYAVTNPDVRKAIGNNAKESVNDRKWTTVSDEVIKFISTI